MGKDVRAVEVTPELVLSLELKRATCFLCGWMVDDIRLHGKLTGYPIDYTGKPEFPIEGKILHLEVEGLIAKLDAR